MMIYKTHWEGRGGGKVGVDVMEAQGLTRLLMIAMRCEKSSLFLPDPIDSGGGGVQTQIETVDSGCN
jgi:hypothetical protein